MSLILEKIELFNIRCHKHFVFEPDINGITAIFGVNGSGKSTVVDSLAWTLYGTRVNNLRTKFLIKEGVSPKKEKVCACVSISIGGIQYLVERRITSDSGSVECNISGKSPLDVDYKHIAGPAIAHCESFIRSALNMDEKGFLASVLIQQKQVDQIVSASPRERGEVIEKLTGISSISSAIAAANEEVRTLQKAAQIIHTGNVEDAEAKVKAQQDKVKVLQDECLQVKSKLVLRQNDWHLKRSTLADLTEKRETTNELESKMSKFDLEIELLSKQLTEYSAVLLAHKQKFGTLTNANAETIKREQAEITASVAECQAGIAVLDKSLVKYARIIKENSFAAGSTIDSCEKKLKALRESYASITDTENQLTKSLHVAGETLRKLKQSSSQIEKGQTNCPVCKQEIPNPEELKVEIEAETAEYELKINGIQKELDEAKQLVTSTISEISDAEKLLTACEILELNNCKTATATDTLKVQKQRLSELTDNLELVNVKYNSIVQAGAIETSVKSAKENVVVINKRIEELQLELKALQDTAKELNAPSVSEYRRLKSEADKFQSESNKELMKYNSLLGQVSLELSRLSDLENNLKEARDSHIKYENLMRQIAISSNSASVMSDFKKDRIEFSIPTLEFFASDILNKFTGGAFIKVSLDEKFNTSITTNTGQIRPISQLSGGELSAAAIALRLGISMLLNSNKRSVLVFDEVLVSMDEAKARQIMETISTIVDCQIIFIAHNSDINSIADKTVSVNTQD